MLGGLGVAMGSLALGVGLVLSPATASAFRGLDGAGRIPGRGHLAPGPFTAPPAVFPHAAPRPFVHRRFFSPSQLLVVAPSPLIVYAGPVAPTPLLAYSAPVVSDPPAPVPVAARPAAPPTPTVVEYPTGRYELRGDGVTTPYTWVWLPNPPPPPSAPPGSVTSPATVPLPPSDPAPAPRMPLYRWLDDDGVVHWTDRLDAVPERYRAVATSTRG